MATDNLPSRGSDPDTSVAAAQTASHHAPIVRDVVLRIMQEDGPLTHDELIGKYHRLVVIEPETPRASDSGIRTRLSELRRAGLIAKDTEEGVSTFGNRAKRWIAVDLDAPAPQPAAAPDDDPVSAALGEDDIVRSDPQGNGDAGGDDEA